MRGFAGISLDTWRYVVVLCLTALSLPSVEADRGTTPSIRLWPLLHYQATQETTSLQILWPVFDRRRSSDESRWRFLLTGHRYNRSRTRDVWDLFWPIWSLQHKESGKTYSRFFPLIWGHYEDLDYAILFPEIWWARLDGGYYLIVFPWIHFRFGDAGHLNMVFPLFGEGILENNAFFAMPLSVYVRNHHNGKYVALLDPLSVFWLAHNEKALEAAFEEAGTRASMFFMIFQYQRRPTGDRRFNILWRLFEYERTGGKRSMRLLFSPRIPLGS
jgi:hypothetical protein